MYQICLDGLDLYYDEERVNQIVLSWIIHVSRLPQIQGAGDEAVVFHRESAATK